MIGMTGIWQELSASMRSLRSNAGMSLRQVEAQTGRGRGLLSQIETGKARPPRELVEWYDVTFGGDGHLGTLFAEARGARGADGPGRMPTVHAVPGDEYEVASAYPASGQRVAPGTGLTVRWVVRNAGAVPWHDRSLRRVGSVSASRLIASPLAVPVPVTAPGGRAELEVPVQVPPVAGTYVAYWEFADGAGRRCFGQAALLAVTVVADW